MHALAVSSQVKATSFPALAVCRDLGQRATTHIAAISSLQKLTAGQTLFAEGEPAANVYETVRGMVRLLKLLPDGRRQITGFLSAGNLLGLAHSGLYSYTAEAVTEVTLCRYPRAQFDRLVDELPGFARRILAMTGDELRSAQDQMLLLGRKAASEKIASFLLMIADKQGAAADAQEVQVPMSRQDIADYLGLTMETVSRSLAKLKQEGLIALPKPTRITLRNRERLDEIAAGE